MKRFFVSIYIHIFSYLIFIIVIQNQNMNNFFVNVLHDSKTNPLSQFNKIAKIKIEVFDLVFILI